MKVCKDTILLASIGFLCCWESTLVALCTKDNDHFSEKAVLADTIQCFKNCEDSSTAWSFIV